MDRRGVRTPRCMWLRPRHLDTSTRETCQATPTIIRRRVAARVTASRTVSRVTAGSRSRSWREGGRVGQELSAPSAVLIESGNSPRRRARHADRPHRAGPRSCGTRAFVGWRTRDWRPRPHRSDAPRHDLPTYASRRRTRRPLRLRLLSDGELDPGPRGTPSARNGRRQPPPRRRLSQRDLARTDRPPPRRLGAASSTWPTPNPET